VLSEPRSTSPEPWSPHLEGAVPFDPARLTEGGSLPAVWARCWAADPSAPALLVEGADGGPRLGAGAPASASPAGASPARAPRAGAAAGRWVTSGELEDVTRAAAVRLAAAGLGPGERMVWSAGTSLASVVACLAALRLGAVVVPANAAYTERELAHVVADVRPALAVVDRPEQAAWVAGAAPGPCTVLSPELVPLDVPGVSAGPGRAGAVLDQAAPGDPALVVYTSGTTGAPKGAVLTHANLLAGTRTLGVAWRWHPDDRLVLALPLFHVHGLCAGLFGTLAAGASAVLLPRFTAEDVLDAAAAHRASLFFGVPTMYHRLLGSGRAGELARLRLCVSGSAPLPASLWDGFRRTAGVAVLERYGMTETLLTVSNPYDGERRPGTVGFPLPGVRTSTAPVGPRGGGSAAGPARDEGQLLVAGPTVFAGYWERPAATEAAFDGSWFCTGDVVSTDAGGYLFLRGRRDDLVISGGYNVYPAEVEDVLLAHPGVGEVAVTGQASEEWGETVVAWIVADGDAPAVEALEALAAERLAPYKRPRRYHVVDALPRNAMGKVQRDRLRE
jgi:malonyl-CoA/methylmalonyl-CoA synthetase